MRQLKIDFFKAIDNSALMIAKDYSEGKSVTATMLQTLIDLYDCAKCERDFNCDTFESAYHSAITSEVEFYIARILYHYSQLNNKKWTIKLRKQQLKTAPDIRLLKDERTFAIIEVKVKAGWIQAFLSPERYEYDRERFSAGISRFNPDDLIVKSNTQLLKYFKTFEISNSDIYMLLPTLALVHRKRYKTDIPGYYSYFASTSGLPEQNFILLSHNKRLDLSLNNGNLEPTTNFELLLERLSLR